MDLYTLAISFAIPIFIILIIIEMYFSRKMDVTINRSFDVVSSLSSGVTNVIKDVLGLVVVIVSYGWLVDHIALFEMKSNVLVYILAFIGIDFAGYWAHRFEHEINILWNRHIIHHSSEEFNLSCALRQNVSVVFNLFVFLYVPMALIGVPVEVIAIVAPIHLFLQFWYHTRLIDRMGVFELFLVTPSHHRVHHAINDEYLDKNFGQIFIFWDKWFGTFQEELQDVPPVYGVKKAVGTWNPVWINFQHLGRLIKDAWYTSSFVDKLKIWFMPTGWRPEDRMIIDPIEYTIDPYTQIKYDTPGSKSLHIWIWIQLIIHLIFMFNLFFYLGNLGLVGSILYGGFIVLGIMAYTSLMDRDEISSYLEGFHSIIGIIFLYAYDGWFGMGWTFSRLVLIYLFASLLANIYFMKNEPIEETAYA